MIALSERPLDTAALTAAVADPEHGATALFVGTTRAEAGRREVVALVYEAYAELALAEMERIAAEIGALHGARLAIAHRIGRVAVGEPSVAVAASAPHRPRAFAACRGAIDALKLHVPIWKLTVHADGAEVWIDGRDPSPV